MEGINTKIPAIELEIEGIKLEIEGSKQEIRDLTTQESNKTLSEEMQLEILRSKTAEKNRITAKENIIAAKENIIAALINEKTEVMKLSAGMAQKRLSSTNSPFPRNPAQHPIILTSYRLMISVLTHLNYFRMTTSSPSLHFALR